MTNQRRVNYHINQGKLYRPTRFEDFGYFLRGKKGITLERVQEFGEGFDVDDWENLAGQYLTGSGYEKYKKARAESNRTWILAKQESKIRNEVLKDELVDKPSELKEEYERMKKKHRMLEREMRRKIAEAGHMKSGDLMMADEAHQADLDRVKKEHHLRLMEEFFNLYVSEQKIEVVLPVDPAEIGDYGLPNRILDTKDPKMTHLGTVRQTIESLGGPDSAGEYIMEIYTRVDMDGFWHQDGVRLNWDYRKHRLIPESTE